VNSDEEKRVFEMWGWTYDCIDRQWVSPSGNVFVPIESLMTLASFDDPNLIASAEGELIGVIMTHGVRRKES